MLSVEAGGVTDAQSGKPGEQNVGRVLENVSASSEFVHLEDQRMESPNEESSVCSCWAI